MAGGETRPRLNDRDLRILRDLWLYRYLTTAQISRLHHGHIKLAQRCMRRLHASGVVDRFRSDGALRAGFRAWVFRLTGKGARVLAEHLGRPSSELAPPRRPPGSMWYLDHHREVTDFRIWLREGCAASDGRFGYRFVPSYEEIREAGRRLRRIALPATPAGDMLVPDGAFTLDRSDGRSALFLLEVDRGTEPLTGRHPGSIERKFELYRQAFDGRAERRYEMLFETGFRGFRILCLVPDGRRRERFLELAREADLAPLVWVALLELTAAPGDLATRAWLTEPGGDPRALVE